MRRLLQSEKVEPSANRVHRHRLVLRVLAIQDHARSCTVLPAEQGLLICLVMRQVVDGLFDRPVHRNASYLHLYVDMHLHLRLQGSHRTGE